MKQKCLTARTNNIIMRMFICLVIITFLLFGCGGQNAGDSEENEGNGIPAANPERPSLSELRENWAWAVAESDWELDTIGPKIKAEAYSSPEAWENLTLATGAGGMAADVSYTGIEEATGEWFDGMYYAFFDNITGPVWTVSDKSELTDNNSIVLLPASFRSGLLALTPVEAEYEEIGGFWNHGHPAASEEDTKIIEASRKDGRKVMHSELLATDGAGGRVSVFQFYNNSEEGLLAVAYINGDSLIAYEKTAGIYGDKAYWRADMDDDDIGHFEVNMLCETDEGLVIATSWSAPEGCIQEILVENGGRFVEFITDGWYFDIWDDTFYHSGGE